MNSHKLTNVFFCFDKSGTLSVYGFTDKEPPIYPRMETVTIKLNESQCKALFNQLGALQSNFFEYNKVSIFRRLLDCFGVLSGKYAVNKMKG